VRSWAIAMLCSAAGASVLALGCGDKNSDGTAKAAARSRAAARAQCPSLLKAEHRYDQATQAMGLRFTVKPLERRAQSSAEAFLASVQQLARASAGRQQHQLTSLAGALSNQVKTLRALVRHDLAQAQKYGNAINVPLRQGRADLRTICPGS
jgi:hypothetical protein